MRVLPRSPPIGGLLLVMLLSACSDAPTEPPEQDVILNVVSGNAQVWIVGYELPDALVVRVTKKQGQGVPNFQVNFRVTKGGGSAYAGSAHTDEHGYARDYWTLGLEPGDNELQVRSVDPTTGEKQEWQTFTAAGKPWPEQLTTVIYLVNDPFFNALIDRLDAESAEYLRAALTLVLGGLGEELDFDQVESSLQAARSLVEGTRDENTVEYAFLDLMLSHCETLFEEAMSALYT
jgi:hypothetical protein